MRGIGLLSRTLLCGIIIAFLAGCGTAGQATQTKSSHTQTGQATSNTTSTPLTSVDWANFAYFSSCYGNTQTFHAKNGQATNDHIHFNVYSPTYGNLTGNKQPDAVVPYQCSAADSSGVHAFVYSGTAAHPVLIANLPLPDPKGTIENITKITISNGVLQLEGTGYSANAPHCCPDLFIKTSYKWQGKSFVIVQTRVNKK
jgi:hypothetical protein